MKKFLLAVVFLESLAFYGYTITVNPASSVTADSAATPLTIPYRDANGDFAMSSLTVASLTNSAQAGPVGTWSRTKAQFDAITPAAAGEIYFCSNCTVPNICVSTGTALSDFVRADDGTKGCGSGE